MRILFCSSTFSSLTHGPSKFAQLFLRISEIDPSIECRVLTEDIENSIPHRIYKASRSYPPIIGFFWVYLDNLFYWWHILKIRRQYKFNVLIFNNAVLGVLSTIFWKRKVKSIGLINDDEYVNTFLTQPQLSKLWLTNISRKPLEMLACITYNYIIVNSIYLRNIVVNNYSTSEKKVKHIYKSIDIEPLKFAKERPISFHDDINILFVKNNFTRGGLFLLAESMGILSHYKFNLVVIGPQEKHFEEIKNSVSKWSNVKLSYLGPLSQDDVFEEMQNNHILCIPARREALGLANIEGLAIGIPVVSSNAGGIPEVLDYGNNGWLSDVNSAESLAEQIENCITNTTQREQKRIAGRVFIENTYTHTIMLKKYIKLLHSLYNKNA